MHRNSKHLLGDHVGGTVGKCKVHSGYRVLPTINHHLWGGNGFQLSSRNFLRKRYVHGCIQ
jgi:hypothetical protein